MIAEFVVVAMLFIFLEPVVVQVHTPSGFETESGTVWPGYTTDEVGTMVTFPHGLTVMVAFANDDGS